MVKGLCIQLIVIEFNWRGGGVVWKFTNPNYGKAKWKYAHNSGLYSWNWLRMQSKAKAGVTTGKKMPKTAERFVEDENYFHGDSNGTLIWCVLLHKRILAKYVDLLPINCVST